MCMGPKMIAFTAFIMLFVLSFTAFIVSLVKQVSETNIVTRTYMVDTRATFNSSEATNSTLLTTANAMQWGAIPGTYNSQS